MALLFARIYFVRGQAPSFWQHRYEVRDPAIAGYSHALILQGDKLTTIFCPYTLNAYQVTNKCGELKTAEYKDLPAERLGECIIKAWTECNELGFQRDFGVAALVLTELGVAVPKFLDAPILPNIDGSIPDEAKRGGKPIVPEALKPCKPSGKRGEVAAFFLSTELQPIHEAMARLELTRSGVLSHLYMLNKEHGVGYELTSNCARLLIPEGFDLLAYVEPERSEKPQRPLGEDGQPTVAKTRGNGKPILPEALKLIPSPTRRSSVAELFLNGWYSLAEAMAVLGLNRSAVLSHLFTIHQDNGLGYELSPDGVSARLLVPEGYTVFGPKISRVRSNKGDN
jgi:hypothetical protein